MRGIEFSGVVVPIINGTKHNNLDKYRAREIITCFNFWQTPSNHE